MQQLFSIEDFARNSRVSVNRVKKRYKEIPGITKVGNTYKVEYGSRYPFPIGRYSCKTSIEKRYAVLRAIMNYKYIDNKMLGIPAESFELILKDLLDRQLIQKKRY